VDILYKISKDNYIIYSDKIYDVMRLSSG
jgi:hypothetical protein